jgi:DNA-directed RNA polymerase specialized sigma24 family protein
MQFVGRDMVMPCNRGTPAVERDRIVALHKEGKSYNEIARLTGRSKNTVRAVVQEYTDVFHRDD